MPSGKEILQCQRNKPKGYTLHLTRPILIADGKRETVGSFLMDREPMYFEWHGAEIQWKGECMD